MSDETFTPGAFLSRKDAAEYVRTKCARPCSVGFLAKLAVDGDGPVFRKIGLRYVVYTREDLDAWVRSQIGRPVRSTADVAAALAAVA
jgi:hypothetical protein